MSTIADVRNNLSGPSKEYRDKQLHPVPRCKVVERVKFIVERCRNQRVLDIGGSGHLYDRIHAVATEHWAVDHPSMAGKLDRYGVFYLDLDATHAMLPNRQVDVVVCGEVVEHLTKPGHLLDLIRAEYTCPVIITVPNAFSDIGRSHLERGIENVHYDHKAWYSYHTLKALLERHKFTIDEFYWYNGRPLFAEGMIAVASAKR